MITSERILEIVSELSNEPIEKIIGSSRKQEIIYPRFAMMKLAREYTNDSLATIGMMLGGRHHSSIIHGVQTMDDFISTRDMQPSESALYFAAKEKINSYLMVRSKSITLTPHPVPTC
jgi:chromosomal replication initiator protein